MRGPFGAAWPLEVARGKDVIVVAGGLGLAPLRPVVYELLRRRADFGRAAVLVGARAPEEVVFRRELERWRKRLDVRLTVDRAGPDWTGDTGVVTTLVEKLAFDAANVIAFVCGPEIMMRFAARALELRGVARRDIHVSIERSMRCAVGFCGHCQLGPAFVCKDGPVFSLETISPFLGTREL